MLPKSSTALRRRSGLIPTLFTAGLMMIFFALLIGLDVPTDIQPHTDILRQHLSSGRLPLPPLYFAGLWLAATVLGGHALPAAAGLLALAFGWRYYLSVQWVAGEHHFSAQLLAGCAMVLLMAPIPYHLTSHWYFGKFTALVLHNSTVIAVFPMCLWLFSLSLRWLQQPSLRTTLLMLLAILLIVLTKPSYLVAFIPCLALFIILQYGITNRRTWAGLGCCLLATILTWLMQQGMLRYNQGLYQPTAIAIAPLQAWLYRSQFPIADLLASFPALLLAFGCWGKRLWQDVAVRLATATLGMSLIIYFGWIETGDRAFSGNLYWQVPVALGILHLAVLRWYVRLPIAARPVKGTKVVTVAAALQALAGVAYMVRVLVAGLYD